MNIKEKKDQIKTWVKENKIVIMMGLGSVAMVVISTIIVTKEVDKAVIAEEVLLPVKPFDPGKAVDMHFIDPETGDILGKVGCYESFMNDMLEFHDSNYYM